MTKAIVFAIALGTSAAALAETKTETIKVSGWKCDQCPPKTAAKVKAVPGVESATADREKGQLVVKYDDKKTKQADLEKAVADSGFAVAK
ncbi:MAG TPA: cation transporter [Myxococcales bacterium]|nr:cation transporter [Myxococcales bacterium]